MNLLLARSLLPYHFGIIMPGERSEVLTIVTSYAGSSSFAVLP